MTGATISPDKLQLHPSNAQLPKMDKKTYEEMRDSIRDGRQELPILVLKDTNLIVDGRHRWEACAELGIDVWYDYIGTDDIGELLWRLNVLRKDRLKKGQLVAFASDRATNPRGQGGNRLPTPTLELAPIQPKTVVEAAKEAGVSESIVYEFREVEKEAPDLAEKVREGKTTVHTALREVKARKEKAVEPEKQEPAAPKKRTAEDVFDELTKKDQVLVNRHVERLVGEVRAAVDAEYKSRAASLNTDEAELARKRKKLEDDRRLVSLPITQHEYKFVLGMLHPDRHPGKEDRAQKAFDIFTRLEGVCRRSAA